MDLEKQAAARSDSLVMVLQDRVSGGQAHPELLHWAPYPYHTGPSPSSSLAEHYGWTILLDIA